MRGEEIEVLSHYDLLTNDADEIMLALPGLFAGEAQVKKLIYGGHQHAVFVRNSDQILLCDYLHEQIRDLLYKSDRILVYEKDAKREYFAEVIHDDIDVLCVEALESHRYYYPYHPFPLSDGTFAIGEAVCDFCGRPARIHYRGRMGEQDEERVACPDCLEEGVPQMSGMDPYAHLREECIRYEGWADVFGGTPPYFVNGQPSDVWGVHCESLGAYLGEVRPGDLVEPLREELKETWDNPMNALREHDPEEVFARQERGEESLHLFRCQKCGRVFCIFPAAGNY